MNLTTFTDYSLRVLMYLKLRNGTRVTVSEVSEYFGVSQNHIVKVVHNLGKMGLIETSRGKGGGFALLPHADQTRLGDLVRLLEPDKDMVACTDKSGVACTIAPACLLVPILDSAVEKFYSELNRYTLADIVNAQQSDKAVSSLKLTLS